jgi:acetolactate synthase-1/2/3 large subunit
LSTTPPGDNLRNGRRQFLQAATVAGLGLSAARVAAQGAAETLAGREDTQIKSETYTAEEEARYFVDSPGSDFVVSVLVSLGIEYVALNPGASFRGLHESLINSKEPRKPQIITCLHEEQAVALAHGYAKVAGKPMAVACHGTVGFQHASMAVYNAWCDQVPVFILGGNHLDAAHREFPVVWDHSALDPIASIRDSTKWDDQPGSLQHFAESAVRAYRVAMTPPMGPVALSIDSHLQESPIQGRPQIPKLVKVAPAQGDVAAVQEAAAQLVGATAPLIVVERYARSQESVELLVELAELLQAPVIDRGERMNFPNTHYLNQTFLQGDLLSKADVILGLELSDVWGLVQQGRDRSDPPITVRTAREEVRLITIGSHDLFLKSNYQNFQRFYPADLPIDGDAHSTLPILIEQVRKASSAGAKSRIRERMPKLQTSYKEMRARLTNDARYAWDATPISTARLCMEVWKYVESKDWALTSPNTFKGAWPNKLWRMDRFYRHIGNEGGYGIGYGCPASVGAALAHKQYGRVAINLQGDGDLMFAPAALWTAAHHQIPLLTIMHNNAGYMQETMLVQAMALQRRRGATIDRARIGTEIDNPRIDFAGLAKSMGVWSAGPIRDPNDLGAALKRAVEIVEAGEPALVDVHCQPR